MISRLFEKGVHTSVIYYGVDDYATRNDVSIVFNYVDIIIEYYEQVSFDVIESVDNYIDYLFARKLCQLSDFTEFILADKKDDFVNKINEFKKINCKYQVNAIITYLNSGIEAICNHNENHDLVCETIKICGSFFSGIKDEVFQYLIENKGHLIIDNYRSIEKVCIERTVLFELLLSEGIILDHLNYRLSTILSIAKSSKNKSKLKDTIVKFEHLISKYGDELINNMNIDNALEVHNSIELLSKYFEEMKSPKTYKYEKALNDSKELIDEWLRKNGNSTHFDIPIDKFNETINSQKPWEIKMLSLTHTGNRETEMLEHCLESIMKNPQRSVFDNIVSTNQTTNSYFDMSRLRSLSVCSTLSIEQLRLYIQDDIRVNEYYSYIKTFVRYICKVCEIDYENIGFSDDLQILFQFTQDIFHNVNETDLSILHSVCYGGVMYTCALTEKILRTIYKKEVEKSEYVSDDWVTLGNLLDSNNKELRVILGEHHIKCLRYYLHTDGKERVGENIRNNFAHWKNIKAEMLTRDLMLKVLWLLTGVINSVFYYYHSKANGLE